MAASFSQQAMDDAAGIRAKILEMPFIKELAEGTIPQDKFQFYLVQDFLYLRQYARVLAMLAARSQDSEATQHMVEAAANVAKCEAALHNRFFTKFGLSSAAVEAAEPSPTCAGYTNFLLACQSQPLEVAFAAVLPCYTIYLEVGTHILSLYKAAAEPSSPSQAANPYGDWIDTYGGDEFRAATRRTAAIVDAMADRASPDARAAMRRSFLAAARFEYMFWDSAYRCEQWPIALDGSSPPAPPAAP